MKAHQCSGCGKPLTGGIDTFGDPNDELCWDCYAECKAGPREPYYGVAPHHHDLSITGTFIGSTVLDGLPPADNGHYDLGYATFTPDPEAPGCGVYVPKPPPGWR